MADYLVDTNILLRIADRKSSHHETARRAVRELAGTRGHVLRTTAQNYAEFWNVATRPSDRNGLGLSLSGAERQLKLMERIFHRLPDIDAVYPNWRSLVVSVGVSGVQVHDARLVAVMQAHGITHLLTFNVGDFTRFVGSTGIIVVDPASL